MKLWKLKSLTLPNSTRTIVAEWFAAQDDAVQAAFLGRMKFLIGLPGDGWDRPYVGQLRRECKGLFEIVIEVGNVQYRPIGYFSGEMEFTFLAFATERDDRLVPASVCDTAKRNIEIIEQHKERAREITI